MKGPDDTTLETPPVARAGDVESCPPHSLLRRIGEDDMPAEVFSRLEPHIERCGHCQAVLQAWADADRIRTETAGSETDSGEHDPSTVFDSVPAIPGFRLIRELGRGGEGVVHLAEEAETQRLVALKFLPGGWLVDAGGRRDWLRQVRATAQFQHANVVRLYRIEETFSWYVMVLEYVAGGTLRDNVRQPVDPVDAAVIVRKLAAAVEEIHRAGVLHLDLKPSNVLLDGESTQRLARREPKISDFGIALRQDAGGIDGRPGGGTPAYMAPEQTVPGHDIPGPATDVYGLGAILYFLLAAKPPFEAATVRDLQAKVRTEMPVFPDLPGGPIDSSLRAICKQAMAKRAEARFATPADLARALESWLATHQPGHTAATKGTGRNAARPGGKLGLAAAGAGLAALYLAWNAPWSGRENPAAAAAVTLPMAEWIRELRHVEPNVFFGERLDRLMQATRVHTADLITRTPGDPELLARTGILVQAMAGRFVSSTTNGLLSHVGPLLEASEKLLHRSHELAPENMTTVRDLAFNEIARGCLKMMDLKAKLEDLEAFDRENARHLEKSIDWIDLLTETRAKIYFASLVLDRCRGQMFEARTKGLFTIEKIWTDLHRKCESRWAGLADRDEIRMRVELARGRRFDPPKTGQTFDPAMMQTIERESIAYILEPLIFGAVEPSAEAIDDAVREAQECCVRYGMERDFLASVAYEDLIRSVSAASTWFRAQNQVESARKIARRFGLLCRDMQARYPERIEPFLAMSEFYLQNWKNDLKAEDPSSAEKNLRESLEEARRATQLEPGNLHARRMLEDRESRLARFESGQ